MAAARKNTSIDFEGRYFDMVDANFKELGAKIDANNARMDKRVTKLENSVYRKAGGQWYQNKALLPIALTCLTVFLYLLAAALNVKVPTP